MLAAQCSAVQGSAAQRSAMPSQRVERTAPCLPCRSAGGDAGQGAGRVHPHRRAGPGAGALQGHQVAAQGAAAAGGAGGSAGSMEVGCVWVCGVVCGWECSWQAAGADAQVQQQGGGHEGRVLRVRPRGACSATHAPLPPAAGGGPTRRPATSAATPAPVFHQPPYGPPCGPPGLCLSPAEDLTCSAGRARCAGSPGVSGPLGIWSHGGGGDALRHGMHAGARLGG